LWQRNDALPRRPHPARTVKTMRDAAKPYRPLDPDLPLDDMMRQWPSTIPVMLRHRFLCVGCPIAPFHTLVDACREHGADLQSVTVEVEAAVAASVPPPVGGGIRSRGSRRSA
jgi:hybrid cluster-associated redox disulfide protein